MEKHSGGGGTLVGGQGNVGHTATVTAERISQVRKELSRLGGAVEGVVSGFSKISEKLTPVLRQDDPSAQEEVAKNEKEPPRPLVPLAVDLRFYRKQLIEVSDLMREVFEALEL